MLRDRRVKANAIWAQPGRPRAPSPNLSDRGTQSPGARMAPHRRTPPWAPRRPVSWPAAQAARGGSGRAWSDAGDVRLDHGDTQILRGSGVAHASGWEPPTTTGRAARVPRHQVIEVSALDDLVPRQHANAASPVRSPLVYARLGSSSSAWCSSAMTGMPPGISGTTMATSGQVAGNMSSGTPASAVASNPSRRRRGARRSHDAAAIKNVVDFWIRPDLRERGQDVPVG
jgi:hypothetical protein